MPSALVHTPHVSCDQRKRGPKAPLFSGGSTTQRWATRNTFGVTKTSSSALLLVRLFFLNRLPRIGMSPRNGIFDMSCWSLISYAVFCLKKKKNYISTAVLISRLAIVGTW